MKKVFFGTLAIGFAANLMAQTGSAPVVEADGKKLQVMNMDAKGRAPWGGYSQIGNAVRSEGDGQANTKAIIAAVGNNAGHNNKPYAASICASLKANGAEDWYLPSVNEMKAVYKSYKAIGLGERNTYWSSTEVNGTQSLTVYMYDGSVAATASS